MIMKTNQIPRGAPRHVDAAWPFGLMVVDSPLFRERLT